jgi:hypothetical protein
MLPRGKNDTAVASGHCGESIRNGLALLLAPPCPQHHEMRNAQGEQLLEPVQVIVALGQQER